MVLNGESHIVVQVSGQVVNTNLTGLTSDTVSLVGRVDKTSLILGAFSSNQLNALTEPTVSLTSGVNATLVGREDIDKRLEAIGADVSELLGDVAALYDNPWLLSSGRWDDSKEWIDNETWNDN